MYAFRLNSNPWTPYYNLLVDNPVNHNCFCNFTCLSEKEQCLILFVLSYYQSIIYPMKNSFFSKFTPHEPKFFPILKEMSDVLLVASDLMIDCLQKFDHETATEYYFKIKEQEL